MNLLLIARSEQSTSLKREFSLDFMVNFFYACFAIISRFIKTNMTDTPKTKFNYKKKLLLILLGMFLLVGWFYWFQYRPAKIRHDCSWVKRHEDAIPAIPSKTVEELKAEGLIKDCKKEPKTNYKYLPQLNESCEYFNNQIIQKYKSSKPAEPAKDWWEEATEQEYKFCLHNKGLK